MAQFSEFLYFGDGKAIRLETTKYNGKSGIDIREMYTNKDGELKETRRGIRIYANTEAVYDGEPMDLTDAFFAAIYELAEAVKEGDDG